MRLRNVTLELSAKAFKDDSESTMKAVCGKLFKQWERITCYADQVSVLLWIADGSEILEYAGNLDDAFEWAYWQGIASPKDLGRELTPEEEQNINLNPVKYRADAALRTYSWLKRLTEIIRETGMRMCEKNIRIGTAFDNGPEFSISDFKYNRHREIAKAHSIYPNSFVTCDAILNADSKAYAAFPDGIPEGTTLGRFLGGQYREFSRDLGFDYLWLSNGMGFGLETWGLVGALFDGKEFKPWLKAEAQENLLVFWRDFLKEYPDAQLETRGSNYSAGIEMSTDAAPLPWLYRNNIITAPVNSPSSSIYFNPGLSIAAWMSHIAELPPNGDIPFRYYIHDPWFLNSPWLDRYGREPWDIYPVMAISRVNAEGKIETANRAALLSCDDSFGNMPDIVPDEVLPHILEGFRTCSDAPGILLWVYPFEEYSQSDTPARTFNEECFIVDALQSGLPLNTVISTGNFRALASSNPEWFQQTICVIPAEVLRSSENIRILRALIASGCKMVVYGTLAGLGKDALELAGLTTGDSFDGEVRIDAQDIDICKNGNFNDNFMILPLFHNGTVCEHEAGARIVARAVKDGKSAVLASVHNIGKGEIAFVRSLSPYLEADPTAHNACLHPRRRLKASGSEMYPAERLIRQVLAEFGWEFRARLYEAGQMPPRLAISRHDGAFIFSGYAPDTTVTMEISSPFGIPLPVEREIRVEDGKGLFHLEKSIRFSCRTFVKQSGSGTISVKTLTLYHPKIKGRIDVIGLCNAELRFFPPPDCDFIRVVQRELDGIHGPVLSASGSKNQINTEIETTPSGCCHVIKNISGIVCIAWGKEK
ncbi:MAG: hypothetical protein JXR78_18700 [Victivallales bacterium]|nr:hypothetical protein [Victivallales bacterium]